MALLGKSRSEQNWEVIKDRDIMDTVAYRDVYGEQQLERSRPLEKTKLRNWLIGGVLLCLLLMVIVYFALAGIQTVGNMVGSLASNTTVTTETTAIQPGSYDATTGAPSYVEHAVKMVEGSALGEYTEGFYVLDADGNRTGEFYETWEEVPVPEWWGNTTDVTTEEGDAGSVDVTAEGDATAAAGAADAGASFVSNLFPDWFKVLVTLLVGCIFMLVWWQWSERQVKTQNMMSDTSDINQHFDDQHVMLPEEVHRQFDFFPDAGAHSSVSVSSMISHAMLSNKGLGTFEVTQRVKEDILDEDGEVAVYAGEPLEDDHGNIVKKTMPIIDTEFGEALFKASDLPEGPLRKLYDTTKIPYNPGNENRDKLKGYDTVADLINGDWEFPEYEVQRPGGAYVVDTAPVNTMV